MSVSLTWRSPPDAVASEGIAVEPLGEIDLRLARPHIPPPCRQVPHALRSRERSDLHTTREPPPSAEPFVSGSDRASCTPKSLNSCNSLSVTSELVAAGLGFSVMTPAIIRADLARRICRFEAGPPIPARILSLAALKETWSAETAFVAKFVAATFRSQGALR